MKKFAVNLFYGLFILMGLSLISCDQSAEKSSEQILEAKIPTEQILDDQFTTESFGCADGYYSEWTWEYKRDLFEKFDLLTCKNGWGMCFQVGFRLVHNCRKINRLTDPYEEATFNPITGDGVSIVVQNEVDKTLTLIFDRNIENYYYFANYNFSFFNIHGDCFVNSEKTIKFVEGNYPKIVDGNYIKYTIPYVE